MSSGALPIVLHGTQVHGLGLGSSRVVPTINIHLLEGQAHDLAGVYAGFTTLRFPTYSQSFLSAIHIGPKPTLKTHRVSIESHLIQTKSLRSDYNTDNITLKLIQHIRDTQAFATIEALKTQIQKDIDIIIQTCGHLDDTSAEPL